MCVCVCVRVCVCAYRIVYNHQDCVVFKDVIRFLVCDLITFVHLEVVLKCVVSNGVCSSSSDTMLLAGR